MSEINKKREKYFFERKDYLIINIFPTPDFLEIVCREGGDYIKFRVYGSSEEDFYIVEKQERINGFFVKIYG